MKKKNRKEEERAKPKTLGNREISNRILLSRCANYDWQSDKERDERTDKLIRCQFKEDRNNREWGIKTQREKDMDESRENIRDRSSQSVECLCTT